MERRIAVGLHDLTAHPDTWAAIANLEAQLEEMRGTLGITAYEPHPPSAG
jgi:hypothetical protein